MIHTFAKVQNTPYRKYIVSDNYTHGNKCTENFDALKRYETTEGDRRSWLHVSSGTLWSTSSDTHQVVEI